MVVVNNEQEFLDACKGPVADLFLNNDIYLPEFVIDSEMKQLSLSSDRLRTLECFMYSPSDAILSLKNIHLKTSSGACGGVCLVSSEQGESKLYLEGENEISGSLSQQGNRATICGTGTLKLNCKFIYIDGKELVLNCVEFDSSPSKTSIWVRKSGSTLKIIDCTVHAVGGPLQAGIELGIYAKRAGGILTAQRSHIIAEGGCGAPGIGVSTDSVGKVELDHCTVNAIGGDSGQYQQVWTAPGAGIGGSGETSERGCPSACLSLHAVGSEITARGGNSMDDTMGAAAGIGTGGGKNLPAGNIQTLYFEECKVDAASGTGPVTGAAIGGGGNIRYEGGSLLELTAKESTFIISNAKGENSKASGAGIGGGASQNGNGGQATNISLTGCVIQFNKESRLISGGESVHAKQGQLICLHADQIEIITAT